MCPALTQEREMQRESQTPPHLCLPWLGSLRPAVTKGVRRTRCVSVPGWDGTSGGSRAQSPSVGVSKVATFPAAGAGPTRSLWKESGPNSLCPLSRMRRKYFKANAVSWQSLGIRKTKHSLGTEVLPTQLHWTS